MQVDWTTKIILVLIAALLAGLLVKSYIETRPSIADTEGSLMHLRSVASYAEGSRELAELFYLFELKNVSEERAIKIIETTSLLLDYPHAKAYAKKLVSQGANFDSFSKRVVEIALSSGRLILHLQV